MPRRISDRDQSMSTGFGSLYTGGQSILRAVERARHQSVTTHMTAHYHRRTMARNNRSVASIHVHTTHCTSQTRSCTLQAFRLQCLQFCASLTVRVRLLKIQYCAMFRRLPAMWEKYKERNATKCVVSNTRRYGPLRGPTSSSCGGLRTLSEVLS